MYHMHLSEYRVLKPHVGRGKGALSRTEIVTMYHMQLSEYRVLKTHVGRGKGALSRTEIVTNQGQSTEKNIRLLNIPDIFSKEKYDAKCSNIQIMK